MSDNLPERMVRNERPKCECFAPDERMFRRFVEPLFVDGQLYPNVIRFPDISVNREKFSEPNDVLLVKYPKYLNWGVFAFKAKDIPTPLTLPGNQDNDRIYEFCIWHDPDDFNYGHSIVCGYQNSLPITSKKQIAKSVRSLFRHKLGEKILPVIEPNLE